MNRAFLERSGRTWVATPSTSRARTESRACRRTSRRTFPIERVSRRLCVSNARRPSPAFRRQRRLPPELARCRRNGCARSRSFRPRRFELCIGYRELAIACLAHRGDDRARDVAHFFLHILVPIERVVTGRVGLVIADETIETRLRACVDQTHPVEPIRQRAPHAFDAG